MFKIRKTYGYELPEEECRDIRTICILGWGLLGDVFMRVPTIELIAKKFSSARIIVVTDPGCVKVFNNSPYVHDVIGLSRRKKPFIKYAISTIKAIRNLRKQNIDLCVDLYAGGSTPLISFLSGAVIRLGFDHTDKLRRYNNLFVTIPSRCGKWIRVIAEMVRPLGIDPDSVVIGTNYYVSEQAMQKAQKLLSLHENRKVIYNLGAGGKEKIWPLENQLKLASLVYERYGAIPVILTSPGHEDLVERFISGYKEISDKIILVPRIDFDVEAAIIKQSDLMFTADSGLMHLAMGVKTPTLAFYNETRPENTEPENMPFCAAYIDIPDEFDQCGYHRVESNLSVEFIYQKLCKFVEDELLWSSLT